MTRRGNRGDFWGPFWGDDGGPSNPISVSSAPALAAMDDADTPADGYTAGTYSSSNGSISSQVPTYYVNGASESGSFDLSAGDEVRVSVLVTDNLGATRTFTTPTVTVTPSVALSNSVLPAISGTAEVGEELTCSQGTWLGSASRTYAYQWLRGGVAISGEVTSTYTLAPADDETTISCRVTADDGFTQVAATATGVAVTYPTPVAAGGLSDQTYDLDSGVQTVNVNSDFTNAVGGTWSVTGTGASISQVGIVSITTSVERTDSVVTVTYTNSGGADSSAFQVTVSDEAAATSALLISVGGQSNSRKAGNSGNTPDAKYTDAFPDVYIWQESSAGFVPYVVGATSGHRGGLDSGVWGSEAEMIYQLLQAGETRPIYIVKESVNGNSLAASGGGDWYPDTGGERYDGYVTQALAAKSAMATAGIVTIEEVFLWNQGEADTNNDPGAAAYGTNLTYLLSELHADGAFLNTGTFIIERIRPCSSDLSNSTYTRQFQVREHMETQAAAVGRIKILSLDYDPSNFNSLHPVEPWTMNAGLRCWHVYEDTYDSTYGAVSDDVPAAFAFTDQTDVTPSAVITSNQLTLSGLGGHSDVTIVDGEYRVLNPDDTVFVDWTSSAGTIHPFQKLQVRVTASGSVSTATSCTITVGGVSDTFTVTTYASAPTYEAETSAFIAQVASNGGGTISGADADALDDFFIAAKATTWWSKMNVLYLRMGDEVASRLDLVGQTVSLYNQGTGPTTYWAWTDSLGWTGAGDANGALGMNVDLSTDWTQNSGTFGFWYSALATNTRGDATSFSGDSFLRYTNAGATRYLLNSAANKNASGLTTALGLRAVVRSGASSIALYGPTGASIDSGTTASAAPVSEEMFIGNPEGTYSDASILGGFVASEALSAAELASIVSIAGTLQDYFDPGMGASAFTYGGEAFTYEGEPFTYGA